MSPAQRKPKGPGAIESIIAFFLSGAMVANALVIKGSVEQTFALGFTVVALLSGRYTGRLARAALESLAKGGEDQ